MKKKPTISNYYELPNPGLRAYFRHNVFGNPEDYRPPFFKGQSRNQVLEQWQQELDSLSIKDKYPDLYNFEMDMKSKVGPMSIQLPLDARLESIESYFTDIKAHSEPISEEAINATIKFFSRAGGIRLKCRLNVVKDMRLSTNSGSPYFTKRRNVVQKTLGQKYNYVDNQIYFDGTRKQLVATLGWRGQEGGIDNDDVKQRVVWMMPFFLNIEELRFYQPAISAMQNFNLIPAYVSMDAVDQEVTKLFDTKGSNDVVICTDFTKFDQHFNKDMQDAAEKIERSLCTPSHETNSWFEKIFKVKFNIPLVCSENIMFLGHHGMGSGSGGTNFDECLSHKSLQFEAALTANAELNPHSMAYGDDGILTYPGIEVEHVIQTYERHGQEMNASKQYVSTHDCVVLRRWHGTEYRVNNIMVGVYSTFRALGRLLAQERYYDPDKWSAEMVTLRALSILENCKWSPYFEKFIQFVMKGDKFRLGLDIPGFFDNLEAKAKKAINEFTDFLGYTKNLQRDNTAENGDDATGIMNWSVVKYLMKLR